jgi:hypothetical protein
MNTQLIQAKFEQLGARAKLGPIRRRRWVQPRRVVIDIGRDRHGEFFDIQLDTGVDVDVLDVQPKDRHLLLLTRVTGEGSAPAETKDKFLCGHDERHWFVAGIPESAPVGTVVTAKEALKPQSVRDAESGQRGKRAKRLRRKTDAFVRQGEWFFLPAPQLRQLRFDDKRVLRNEPIRRGRSKPHRCEFLYREGGETVHFCARYPNGLSTEGYRALLRRDPNAAKEPWRVMQRNARVYVRGRVSHPDHATIRLDGWHRVEMNTETQSRAMAQVAFLD